MVGRFIGGIYMIELTSTVIRMFPIGETSLPPTMGHYGHAAFFAMIKVVDPNLAGKLHGIPGAKPFTVSPLQGKFRSDRKNKKLILSPENEYWMRFTLMSGEIYEALTKFFLSTNEMEIRLGEVNFKVTNVITSGADPWSGYTSYEKLMESGGTSRKFPMEFRSPTAFRGQGAGGTFTQALPLPNLCFNSWLRKWNEFSPIPMDVDLVRAAIQNLVVAEYRIQTQMMQFPTGKQVGFEGRVKFEVKWGVSEEAVRLLNVLANFAFYCGTGYKTTMGMGQTRRCER